MLTLKNDQPIAKNTTSFKFKLFDAKQIFLSWTKEIIIENIHDFKSGVDVWEVHISVNNFLFLKMAIPVCPHSTRIRNIVENYEKLIDVTRYRAFTVQDQCFGFGLTYYYG